MRHIGFDSCKVCEQIKICALMFSAPKKFIQQVGKEKKINISLLFIVLFIQLGCNFDHILNKKFLFITTELGVSFLGFWVYMWCLIYLAKGKPKLHHIINASLYVHILYIIINLSEEIRVISVVVYCIGSILALIIRMAYLKVIFEGKQERIKYILYVEVGSVVLAGLDSLMNYVGNNIIYVKKLLYYSLLG